VNIEREATLVAGLVDAQAGFRRPIAPGKNAGGVEPNNLRNPFPKNFSWGWVVIWQVPDMLLVSGVWVVTFLMLRLERNFVGRLLYLEVAQKHLSI